VACWSKLATQKVFHQQRAVFTSKLQTVNDLCNAMSSPSPGAISLFPKQRSALSIRLFEQRTRL
jgi:vancomycin permeability regulator SanA